MIITQTSKKILLSLQRHWGSLFQSQVINLIAYGSAAFPQTQDHQVIANNTVDLLVEVQDSYQFHKNLLSYKPSDYSGASKIFGASFLQMTQHIFPMHSNHIELDGKKIKYSVIEKSYFRNDLRSWKYLSFAGRLHKPVLFIKPVSDQFDIDLYKNRQIAVAVALLLLEKGKSHSFLQIFYQICSISYLGDVRFAAGAQNPKKVNNIVQHNQQLFKEIYLPLLYKISNKIPSQLLIQNQHFTIIQSEHSLTYLIFCLPQLLLSELGDLYPGKSNIIHRILKQGTHNLSSKLASIISGINKRNSMLMACENLVSGSPWKNLSYLMAKVKKKQMK